jgi:hypothetical protein
VSGARLYLGSDGVIRCAPCHDHAVKLAKRAATPAPAAAEAVTLF